MCCTTGGVTGQRPWRKTLSRWSRAKTLGMHLGSAPRNFRERQAMGLAHIGVGTSTSPLAVKLTLLLRRLLFHPHDFSSLTYSWDPPFLFCGLYLFCFLCLCCSSSPYLNGMRCQSRFFLLVPQDGAKFWSIFCRTRESKELNWDSAS